MDHTQRKQQPWKPVAVVISDIHFNLQNLSLASAALKQAIDTANHMGVQLIVTGDTHDSKANIRGECIKPMLDLFEQCNKKAIVIVANHDRLNERAKAHALEFLRNTVRLITEPELIEPYGYILPYYHDPDELRAFLKTLPERSRILMHQGVQGSNSGEYIQDKSAIRPEDVAGMTIRSGHYHQRQTIKLPDNGVWDYIGNPYSQNYAEASDPEKGYQLMYDDGSLEFIPTNLRRHIVAEFEAKDLYRVRVWADIEDLLWIKVHGTKEELSVINKDRLTKDLLLPGGFRLDLIPTAQDVQKRPISALTQVELIDSLIDQQNASEELKTRLKQTWRGM